MKDLPRIASMLYCEPWVILPQVHGELCSQFDSYLSTGGIDRNDAADPVGPAGQNPMTGQVTYYHPQVEVNGDVALISVNGIMGKHLSTLAMRCGGYDTGLLVQQLANVEADESIKTLVIDFRTPGGMAIGTEVAALAIRKVSEAGKKVIGYSDLQCCSGGYWLVSACDEFYCEGSAMIGSISTYCWGVDDSKEWADKGREMLVFKTGSIKGIGMPGKAWTQEEKDFMQDKADSIDQDFKGFVQARRGLSDDLMQGHFWYAKHAPAGLVDGFVDRLEDLLAMVMN